MRIDWIDKARFAGIFLVVLGHCISAKEVEYAPIRNFIYSFHMPLFIFISGLLYKPKRMIDIAVSLLVPYLIYQLSNILWIIKGSIVHLSLDYTTILKMLVSIVLGNGYERYGFPPVYSLLVFNGIILD